MCINIYFTIIETSFCANRLLIIEIFIFPIPLERIQNPAEPALSGIELGPKIVAGPDKFTDIVSLRYLLSLIHI